MLDLILDFFSLVGDYFFLYKRDRKDFLEGLKLEGLSFLLLAAGILCITAWKLWLLGVPLLIGAVWFTIKGFRHVTECVNKHR